MRYLLLIICFAATQMIAQTTQPSTVVPSAEEAPAENKILQQLRDNKAKEEVNKKSASDAIEAEVRKTGKLPTTQPKRKATTEKAEAMLSDQELMAKNGIADSKNNALGGATQEGPVPNFKGVDQNGKTIELKELLKEGEVVVMFYRGHWCGICNKQLAEVESKLNMLTEKGATVVAITTESNEFVNKTVDKNNLSFSVISDKDGKIARDYNVLYEVTEAYQKRVSSYTKSSIQKFNDSEGAYLPIPATYIIGQNGMVTWKHYTIDYTQRANIEEVAKYLK